MADPLVGVTRSIRAIPKMCKRHTEIWDAAIEAAARVADQEWDQKPIVAPLTNAAYDEAARTIAINIRALKYDGAF